MAGVVVQRSPVGVLQQSLKADCGDRQYKQIHGFNQGIVVRTYENHFSHDSNGRTNVNFMLSEDRTMSTGNVSCQKLKEILTMTFGCFRCQLTRKARIMCEICNPALLLFFDAM